MIASVGFPIAVATFLLLRLESRIGLLTDAITKLDAAIDILITLHR